MTCDTFRVLHGRKPQICRWNFTAVSHCFRDVSIFGFGGHSGCRSLLESPRDILFELAMVENLRFAVGILTISVTVSQIKYFRFELPS